MIGGNVHSMESSQNVLKMFRGYQIVTNILKEKGAISGGGYSYILVGVATTLCRTKERSIT